MSTNMSLNVLTNYNSNIEESDLELFKSYMSLVQTLLNHIHTNITIHKIEYLKYIITYGIDSITHIYKLLLYYTKNLSLTIHHCEKSILFYVEFITQIGDDNHSFLQLTSKDAVMFLYKKTLFELDETYIKNCVHSTDHINKVEHFHLISKLMSNMIRHNVIYYTNMDKLMNDIFEITTFIIQHYDFLLSHCNLIIDLIVMLGYNKESSVILVTKIINNIRKKKNLNVLEIFHTISI